MGFVLVAVAGVIALFFCLIKMLQQDKKKGFPHTRKRQKKSTGPDA